jgi:hypothetical protein
MSNWGCNNSQVVEQWVYKRWKWCYGLGMSAKFKKDSWEKLRTLHLAGLQVDGVRWSFRLGAWGEIGCGWSCSSFKLPVPVSEFKVLIGASDAFKFRSRSLSCKLAPSAPITFVIVCDAGAFARVLAPSVWETVLWFSSWGALDLSVMINNYDNRRTH